MIPALVLTAGLATRLRPLSSVRAKAALPVAGVPLVCRILQSLARAGIADVALNLHHLPHTITSIVGDGSDLGLRVRYSWEVPILGSAGGPRRAMPLLFPSAIPPTASFLIVNGDTLTDVDLGALVADHERTGALVTLAVIENSEPDKYNGFAVSEDGSITGRVLRGTGQRSYHFVGAQAARVDAFADVSPNVPSETVAGLYLDLIARRPGSVRAYRCTAEFFDIGTPADYLRSSILIGAREGRGVSVGARARIDATARVEASILWDDVTVGAGALLRECVVADGVHVPADTSWHGVSLRRPDAALAPGERVIDGLAIASI